MLERDASRDLLNLNKMVVSYALYHVWGSIQRVIYPTVYLVLSQMNMHSYCLYSSGIIYFNEVEILYILYSELIS